MKDWNGKEIESAKSKGGVIVVSHPLDGLIYTGCSPWPTPEIVQKLYKSNQLRSFSEDQHAICTSGIKYYCDLQSLHSEDAITWSVFGTMGRVKITQREEWLADFFKLLDLPKASPNQSEIFLWRRIPHPDTLVSGGPEIDFGIITKNTVVFGEAKWKSQVKSSQGKRKNKDQIQLRGEWLIKYGTRLFPESSVHAVVGIGRFQNSFIDITPLGFLFRSVTWEDVCSIKSHPYAEEVQRYYKWKKEHTK